MEKKIGLKAIRHNPALKPFEHFIGEWETEGSHPYVPDTVLHGRASIEWIEGGAFLLVRSEIDHPDFPDGIEIFGSDDVEKKFFMLHFDERGVSRKYDVTMDGHHLMWKRDDLKFSQRFTLTIEDNGSRLISQGEMSQNGAAWEKDLELTYKRVGNERGGE